MTLRMIKEGWRDRLDAAIKNSGRSDRSLSLEAGLGENYVQQMRTKGKMPGADALIKLCETLGVSVTYIFSGAKMTPEEEEMLVLFSSLDDAQKKTFLDFLHSLQPNDVTPE